MTDATVFGNTYAALYEALYQTKDYSAECDFLETCFQNATQPVRTVLDLGTGAGGHAVRLAQRGYTVTGVDRSEHMLAHATAAADAAGVRVDLAQADIREVRLERRYDAVLAMFAVMGYQTTNADFAAALATAAAHLNPGGILIFDGWSGPGVLLDPPVERFKTVERDSQTIIRFTTPMMDPLNHTVATRFRVWVLEGNRVVDRVEETHLMRFFFPQELSYYLEVAGLQLVRLCPFMQPDRCLYPAAWQFACMATPRP